LRSHEWTSCIQDDKMTFPSKPIVGFCPGRHDRQKSPVITYKNYDIVMLFVFMLKCAFPWLQ
jgi:hypothetical protein